MNIILLLWVLCFTISIVLQSILINKGNDNSTDVNSDSQKIDVFMGWFSGLLSLTGFILFIIWLTKFNNKLVLWYMWIVSLILTIILVSMSIFITNHDDAEAMSFLVSGYTFIIFIGTLISYFVKKN
jgi:cytochrome bd-type quinol oxidase subunit 2